MAFYSVAPLPDTNARQSAMTVRPSSTALLTIDSEDRYKDYVQSRASPSSPYNFSIQKTESLMPGFMTRLGVSEVVFPWTIPNINLKTQEVNFTYQVGAAPIALGTITLLTGFYTPAQIAAQISQDISGLVIAPGPIPGFVMTYSSDPVIGLNIPAFYYKCPVGTTISFQPLTYNTSTYPYPAQTKQLFDLLGFSAKNQILANSNTGAFTLCQAIRYVDIVCNQLTNSQAQKDQTSQTVARDMLCRVYLGDGGGTGQSTVLPNDPTFCPPGCAPLTIYRNFTLPKQIQWIPNQNIPGFLQFQVYDDAGDLLDNSVLTPAITGGFTYQMTDWSMSMLISEC